MIAFGKAVRPDRLTQRRKDRKDAKAGQMLRARLCVFAIFASLRETLFETLQLLYVTLHNFT